MIIANTLWTSFDDLFCVLVQCKWIKPTNLCFGTGELDNDGHLFKQRLAVAWQKCFLTNTQCSSTLDLNISLNANTVKRTES